MVHFYGNSQSCISLVCIARSLRQEETDGFSIIDVNELPSVASLRNAIKSKSQISGSVHTHTTTLNKLVSQQQVKKAIKLVKISDTSGILHRKN